ncbi:MAG: transporter substrate-binding domain-containing protein [Oligoflexales bacterium]|nr:transporter substrate-binding domain-containing protein [Oligoflexales bacterium]
MRIVSLFVFAAGFMATTLFAQSGDKKPRVYKVGVETQAYFPAYQFTPGGKNDSASFTILEAFAKSANIKFEYVPLPINRLYLEFFEQKFDFKYPDHPTWKQELKKGKKITYSQPVLEYIDGLLVHKDDLGRRKLADIKTIGTVMGFTVWDYLKEVNNGQIKVTESVELSKVLRMVIEKMINGVYINIAVGDYQMRESLKMNDVLVFDPSLPHTRSAYLLSTIKYPEVIDEFNKFREKNQGDLDAIGKKYRTSLDILAPAKK